MKENGRNIKLRNFAATRLPRGGIKKIPPVKGRDEGKRLIAKAEC